MLLELALVLSFETYASEEECEIFSASIGHFANRQSVDDATIEVWRHPHLRVVFDSFVWGCELPDRFEWTDSIISEEGNRLELQVSRPVVFKDYASLVIRTVSFRDSGFSMSNMSVLEPVLLTNQNGEWQVVDSQEMEEAHFPSYISE